MCPHAISPSPETSAPEDLLETFSITQNAFLPSEPPLSCLPDAYYTPWESLINHLPTLIKQRTLREQVLQLPVLTTNRLASEPEWRRAYVILTFLTHAYIWGGDVPEEILPPPLTVPLLAASEHLDLPPVATYAALNLWNWRVDPAASGPDNPDGLRALHTFTGSESESWFYMVSVAMEAQAGAQTLPALVGALRALRAHDVAAAAAALGSLAACIRRVTALLARMHERCDPQVFYHDVRPFLAGSRNMAAAGLPRGVFYDEGPGARGCWRQLRGGSNGQSSLIQLFDVALGVAHKSGGHGSPHAPDDNGMSKENGEEGEDGDGKENKNKKEVGFFAEVREYMPGPHRRFLEHVARMGSLRNFALREGDDPEQTACRAAYLDAVDALTELRNVHLKVVTRYIVVPSRTSRAADAGKKDLASASSGLAPSDSSSSGNAELTGTGGTALLPFLRQARQETIEAGMADRREIPACA
ncbi:indoleamine 2,3-dioxygenase [Xylariaceae sp. FL0804]|nr:indoleamine 2,3-dioxygenase [Xylariaceae sp. FL0804]